MTDGVFAAPAVPARSRPSYAGLVPPRWFPPAAVGAGLATALLTVDYPHGIGITLALAAAGAALLPAVRVARADWPLVALGAALAVLPAVRDASWLVALDVLAVLALGCLVLVGVRGWHSIAVAAVSVPLRALPAPAFLVRGVSRGTDVLPLLRGLTAGGVLLAVFGALFASADAVFGELAGRVLPDPSLLPAQVPVFVVVTLLVGGGLLAHLAPVALPAAGQPRRFSRVEWLLPLVALDLLFAVFVTVQLAVLFGGDERVASTAGLTYAEYARSGFFQLIAVTALTFLVVAAAVRWAPHERLPRVLLGVLCGLTGVVLVSAIRRLALYERAFGLSVDRVLAHTVALWLGVVLVLVVVAGLTGRAGWLPRAVAGTAAGALLALNVANPEALIARSLVDRYERTGAVDSAYLARLEADAVPELLRLPEPLRSCVLSFQDVDDDGWPGANLARSRARRLLPADRPRQQHSEAGYSCG